MALIDVGRVCRITRGRNAFDYCIVMETGEGNNVVVEGLESKRRKINLSHIEPTPTVIQIKKSATREEILKKLKDAGFN
jgi:ribosomal protein L14E/L6E/L27E